MEKTLLSRQECEQILEAQYVKGYDLRNFEVVPAKEALGYLGEYYRLILHCKKLNKGRDDALANIKIILFMKVLPSSSGEAGKAEIFQKEANLYATLLKDLQACTLTQWCPKMYFTRSDLIVLQDLCSFGFTKCHKDDNNLNDDELKAVLSALASFHAASIILENRNRGSIISDRIYPTDIFKEISIAPDIAWFTTGLKTILDLAKLHPKYQSKAMQAFIAEDLERHLCSVYEMLNPSKKYRNVVCHRDPWCANVLFDYTDMSAILVDFQTCRYCPPSIDVLLAIYMNQPSNVRRDLEKTYLMWYYEKFKHELERHHIDIDGHVFLEELQSSFQDFKLFGLLYNAIATTLIAVPKELVTNDYKYVDRTGPLVNCMTLDAQVRSRVETCIADLLDFVMEDQKIVGGIVEETFD